VTVKADISKDLTSRAPGGHPWAFLDEAAHPDTGDETDPAVLMLEIVDRPGGRE
jgi:hypothetical protein